MKKIKILIFVLLLFNVLALNVSVCSSAGDLDQELRRQDQRFIGEVGLNENVSLSKVVSQIIKVFLSFLGVIFIVLIIYAGFTWMTAAGNEEKIDKAKKTMVSAIIGLAIVLSAYALTYFVIDQLLEATRNDSGLD